MAYNCSMCSSLEITVASDHGAHPKVDTQGDSLISWCELFLGPQQRSSLNNLTPEACVDPRTQVTHS